MTDQIPADKVREIAAAMRAAMSNTEGSPLIGELLSDMYYYIRDLEALLPPRPTLADITLDEQDECTGMQADLVQGDRVVILDGTPDHDGLVQVLEKSLDVYSPSPDDVTPRTDLPRLEWPGDREDAR